MRTTWQRPDGIMRVTRDVDMDLMEARARSRRVPVAMMVIFIMFLTMGFDLEADWFAGQSGSARYRYSQRLLYDFVQPIGQKRMRCYLVFHAPDVRNAGGRRVLQSYSCQQSETPRLQDPPPRFLR